MMGKKWTEEMEKQKEEEKSALAMTAAKIASSEPSPPASQALSCSLAHLLVLRSPL
jgi:hypothetical protein